MLALAGAGVLLATGCGKENVQEASAGTVQPVHQPIPDIGSDLIGSWDLQQVKLVAQFDGIPSDHGFIGDTTTLADVKTMRFTTVTLTVSDTTETIVLDGQTAQFSQSGGWRKAYTIGSDNVATVDTAFTYPSTDEFFPLETTVRGIRLYLLSPDSLIAYNYLPEKSGLRPWQSAQAYLFLRKQQ